MSIQLRIDIGGASNSPSYDSYGQSPFPAKNTQPVYSADDISDSAFDPPVSKSSAANSPSELGIDNIEKLFEKLSKLLEKIDTRLAELFNQIAQALKQSDNSDEEDEDQIGSDENTLRNPSGSSTPQPSGNYAGGGDNSGNSSPQVGGSSGAGSSGASNNARNTANANDANSGNTANTNANGTGNNTGNGTTTNGTGNNTGNGTTTNGTGNNTGNGTTTNGTGNNTGNGTTTNGTTPTDNTNGTTGVAGAKQTKDGYTVEDVKNDMLKTQANDPTQGPVPTEPKLTQIAQGIVDGINANFSGVNGISDYSKVSGKSMAQTLVACAWNESRFDTNGQDAGGVLQCAQCRLDDYNKAKGSNLSQADLAKDIPLAIKVSTWAMANPNGIVGVQAGHIPIPQSPQDQAAYYWNYHPEYGHGHASELEFYMSEVGRIRSTL